MPPKLHAGATLLLDTSGGLHLHILLNDPMTLAGYGCPQVVLVSVTSIKPEKPYDTTVVLHVGDHPFIKHPSYIAYRFADVKDAKTIMEYPLV